MMKGVLLLSSGIDSPVAGHIMVDRGIEVKALYMDMSPHTSGLEKEKVGDLARILDIELFCGPHAPFQEEVLKRCDVKYQCLMCKRFMYRVASAFAMEIGADFIITGESLGQVASQTLDNMLVLDRAAEIPVIRPIIGCDKEDTINIAREIGTLEISQKDSGACQFVPKKPSTAAKVEALEIEEAKLPLEELVAHAVKNIVSIPL